MWKERSMSAEHGVALITGAGRGLGRAFAIALAEAGFKVAVTARTEAEIHATAEVIRSNGGRVMAIPGDVTNRQAVERAVATTEAELGPIDLLINNAGVLSGGLIGTIDPDEWWRDMDINLRGPFLFVNAILPGMLARGRGRIINVASGAGLQAIETGAAYCVSKAALIRLSEIIALETTSMRCWRRRTRSKARGGWRSDRGTGELPVLISHRKLARAPIILLRSV